MWARSTVTSNDIDVEQLRDKIRGKLDIAKTLGTLIAATLTFVLTYAKDGALVKIADDDKLSEIGCILCNVSIEFYTFGMLQTLFAVAIISLFFSLFLYFSSIYAFDRLLSHRKLWIDRECYAIDMYRWMLKAWRYLFTPATWLLVLALSCLAFVVLRPNPWEALGVGLLIGAVGTFLFFAGRLPSRMLR